MRILILQLLPDVRNRRVPRFAPQLGTLLTLLKQRGHELALLGLSSFDVLKIKAALAKHLPQLIYADISAVCADLARRTLQHLHDHEFLPIVAGGEYATVEPAAALSLPSVQAVAIGEPDASLVTYFERIKDPAAGQVVLGVWLRDEKGLARPDMPALVEDLDSLPFPERDLFGYDDYVKATGQIEIATGRGCPQQCAYCINDWIESIYDEKGTWTRRRSPDNVLDEIDQLRQNYADVRIVYFTNHAFALDPAWLEPFLEAYARRCTLPFRCHVRANAADDSAVTRLAKAGCKLADIELISGSNFVRNEIFDMDLSGEQIEGAFERLHEAGIATRAILYLGAPYESEVSLDETAALLRRLKPSVVDVRPYFPWPGTRARETARDNGWLHLRGAEQYHRDATGIDMPACRPAIVAASIKKLRREFPAGLTEPWWRRWSSAGRAPIDPFFPKQR